MNAVQQQGEALQILGISGSLRAESTNTRLLAAASHLLPPGVRMHLTTCLAELPPFSPDLSPDDFGPVRRWVREMKVAEAIVVSTPEYARGYPGVLKNAFDWLVSTDAHVDKPFMLLSASARSTVAQTTFTTVLETMSGIHIEDASTTIALLGTRLSVQDLLNDPDHAERIRNAMSVFVTEISRRAEKPSVSK